MIDVLETYMDNTMDQYSLENYEPFTEGDGIAINQEINSIMEEFNLLGFEREHANFTRIISNIGINGINEQVLTEGFKDRVKSFFAKIKEFLKKIWEKIKEFFGKIKAFFTKKKKVDTAEVKKFTQEAKTKVAEIPDTADRDTHNIDFDNDVRVLSYAKGDNLKAAYQKAERSIDYVGDKYADSGKEVMAILDSLKYTGSKTDIKRAEKIEGAKDKFDALDQALSEFEDIFKELDDAVDLEDYVTGTHDVYFAINHLNKVNDLYANRDKEFYRMVEEAYKDTVETYNEYQKASKEGEAKMSQLSQKLEGSDIPGADKYLSTVERHYNIGMKFMGKMVQMSMKAAKKVVDYENHMRRDIRTLSVVIAKYIPNFSAPDID